MNFDADFSQKWLIPLLCYSLELGMKYHIKYLEGSILTLQGFSQVFDIISLYVMFKKPKSGIFVIFVKKSTIEFDL